MFKVAIVGGENMGNYPFFEVKCVNCLKDKVKSNSEKEFIDDLFFIKKH